MTFVLSYQYLYFMRIAAQYLFYPSDPLKKLLNINCFNIFFMLVFYFISLFEFLWENIYTNYNNNIRKYSSSFFLYLWFYSKITQKYKIIILYELVLSVFCVSHWEKTKYNIMASYYTYLSSIYRVFCTLVYFINDYRYSPQLLLQLYVPSAN